MEKGKKATAINESELLDKKIVVVVNYSGNVGKTTLAKNLLATRLNAKIVAIETINAGYDKDQALPADQTRQILLEAFEGEDSVVIDVGASNSEIFFDEMKAMKRQLGLIDHFVIPTTDDDKALVDTMTTADPGRVQRGHSDVDH